MLSRAVASSPEPHEPETPQPAEPARPRRPLGRRGLLGVLAAALLALGLFFVFRHLDGYLRRTLEANINQRLHGYHVTLGKVHLHPLGLSLTLHDLIIRQDANPEPPVADIPRLTTSVEWAQILSGHRVADAVFDQPRVHVNLPQLEAEARSQVKLKDRGWQQAFESIYPLKFNQMQVRDGDLVYIDTDPGRPLHISHWNATASNIRNIRSRDRFYPSPIHSDGVVFDTGRAALNGNADFLAEPYPGVHVLYNVQNVPLDRLQTFGARASLKLSGGALSSHGEVEYGPRHREARIADVTVTKLHLDYIHSAATAAAEKARGKEVEKAVQNPKPGMPVTVARLRLVDSNLGVVSPVKDGKFRFFVDGASLDVTNLSSGFWRGPVQARLAGRFLGNGSARGSATVRGENDFNFAIAVDGASLPSINDLLRSYGKFDVANGTFSVYSEIRIRDGRVNGYVKPLFKDIQVYDPQKDKNKPVLKKLYEKVVGGVAHALENHQRDQVATVADLSGPVSKPNTSTWEIFTNLVSNAFVKAILPGFQREVAAAHGKR
jgi:hypothetical protein